MPDVSTTPKQLLAKGNHVSFVVRADIANTDYLKVSEIDPSLTDNFDVLNAGDEISFEGYNGSLFIVANSGTMKYHTPFWDNQGGFVRKQ